jgi:hypothetical protein
MEVIILNNSLDALIWFDLYEHYVNRIAIYEPTLSCEVGYLLSNCISIYLSSVFDSFVHFQKIILITNVYKFLKRLFSILGFGSFFKFAILPSVAIWIYCYIYIQICIFLQSMNACGYIKTEVKFSSSQLYQIAYLYNFKYWLYYWVYCVYVTVDTVANYLFSSLFRVNLEASTYKFDHLYVKTNFDYFVAFSRPWIGGTFRDHLILATYVYFDKDHPIFFLSVSLHIFHVYILLDDWYYNE